MVIFTGGSWGVGEWKFYKLSGPSVVNYFSEQDPAINLCRSGISAKEQLDSLHQFLTKYKHDHNDTFYWLVHNPIVDVLPQDIYQDFTSLENAVMHQLHKQMAQANAIALDHNIDIKLIGASCDLNTVDVSDYSRLKTILPSWGRLLVNDYPTSIFAHQADHMTELKQALEVHRPDLLDEYNVIGGLAFKKRRCMQNNEEMFHSFHPTSAGHLKLKNYLCLEETNKFY